MSKRNNMADEDQTSTVDHLKEKAAEIRHSLGDMGEEIRGQVRESFERGREKARGWEEGLERYVQEQPFKSMLIAAGVGWLIGALWRRR